MHKKHVAFSIIEQVDAVLVFKGSANLRRIVVLNPKGGSGKTTLAFNLAGYLAATGRKVAVIDMDRQGRVPAGCITDRPIFLRFLALQWLIQTMVR